MAKKKKLKDKSPFEGHSIEQIAYAEATSYVIQVGVDFFESKGHLTFGQKQAEGIYMKLLVALQDSVKNGSREDRETALKCLATLQILPLRIQ
jgi:hypothetical protein